MEHSLIQLVSYNLWANEKMAETLRPVGDAIIHAEMKSSFASISKTLHHLADAQVVWLKRLKGEPLNVPSGNFNGSKEELFRKLLGHRKN